jgi:hypothetical protein
MVVLRSPYYSPCRCCVAATALQRLRQHHSTCHHCRLHYLCPCGCCQCCCSFPFELPSLTHDAQPFTHMPLLRSQTNNFDCHVSSSNSHEQQSPDQNADRQRCPTLPLPCSCCQCFHSFALWLRLLLRPPCHHHHRGPLCEFPQRVQKGLPPHAMPPLQLLLLLAAITLPL